MKKMQKTAKILDTFIKIIFVLCALVCILVLAAAISLAIVKPQGDIVNISVTLGNVRFLVAPDGMPDVTDLSYSFASLAYVFCVLIFTGAVLMILRKILRPMAAAQPFSTAVSKNLKRLSWIVLAGGAVISVVNMLMEDMLFRVYDYANLFSSDKILSCALNYKLDGTFIPVFALLYLLAYVFQYGEELQRQSDETL